MGVGPDEARASAGLGVATFLLPGRFQPQKNLQLSLVPLSFVRPVTSKVAGSSPVAPAICKDLPAVIASVPTFFTPSGSDFLTLIRSRAYDFDRVAARP